MGQADYEEVVSGGGLKLKGTSLPHKKKKKKSSSSNKDKLKADSLLSSQGQSSTSGSSTTLAQLETLGSAVTRVEKTTAERRFEEVQKKRLAEKAKKQALKTHKDRVADFNDRLEAQSEHFDIPKVGPG